MSEDCFFIVDIGENEENTHLKVLCLDCYQNGDQNNGWFWEGSVRGYSPYVFKCKMCEKIIHQPEE
jgi:hypothetical protein